MKKIVILVFAAMLLSGDFLGAQSLNTGDILVVDPNSPGGQGAVFVVNPVTGEQTIFAIGGAIIAPVGLAIAANGDILVSAQNFGGRNGAVVRVNPVTGAQSIVTQPIDGMYDLAIEACGDILVGKAPPGEVIRVNPTTGTRTVVSSGGMLVNPVSIAVEADGTILVADPRAFGQSGPGAIFRLNPTTGAQSLLATGGNMVFPEGVAVASNGDIYVTDPVSTLGTGQILRVDPVTGAQAVVSSGDSLIDPLRLTIDNDGGLIVADQNGHGPIDPDSSGPGAIIRVNPDTGAQTVISSGGMLFDPIDVAVVPPPRGRIDIGIDIKPGSFPNSLNLGSGGTVAVALLTTACFDATTVDPTRVSLASAPVQLKGKGTPMASVDDVDGDGLMDLVVHVSTEALQLSETDTQAILEGTTYDGTAIRGTDSVRIVP